MKCLSSHGKISHCVNASVYCPIQGLLMRSAGKKRTVWRRSQRGETEAPSFQAIRLFTDFSTENTRAVASKIGHIRWTSKTRGSVKLPRLCQLLRSADSHRKPVCFTASGSALVSQEQKGTHRVCPRSCGLRPQNTRLSRQLDQAGPMTLCTIEFGNKSVLSF